jgi:hypothetical protein
LYIAVTIGERFMGLSNRISVRVMRENLSRTLNRFPLPVIFSAITTILFIIQIERIARHDDPLIFKSIFVSVLGFFFTLVSTLFIEKNLKDNKGARIFHIIVLSLLAYLFITLPDKFRETDYIIFALYLSASFFALMFIYAVKESEKFFGIYNITLFIRAFISFVFAVVLFLGLASAVYAVQELFLKGNFHHEIYGDLWVCVAAFFAPVYFLGGLPDAKESPEDDFSFPKALKILLQYIIIPLVFVYMLILYVYAAKIIVTQVWPEGIVSYLIISYSLVGIAAIILLSPLKDDENFAWTRTFAKYFFRALLPLIIILFMAISKRIGQYGVTEKRYFIYLLSFWLAGTALYMVFGKIKDLKLLPISLSIVSVLSLYGPWSAFSVSQRSQKAILFELLTRNGIMNNCTIEKISSGIPFEDRKSISSIISYFYDSHGIQSIEYLKPLYQKLSATSDKAKDPKNEFYHYRDSGEAVPRKLLVKEGLGFDFIDRYQTENNTDFVNAAVTYYHDPVLEDISGYDSFIDCRDNQIKEKIFDKNSNVWLSLDSDKFKIFFTTETADTISAIDLNKHALSIISAKTDPLAYHEFSPAEMTVYEETENLSYKVIFRNFNAKRKDKNEDYKLTSAHFLLYYKFRPAGE